MLRFFNKTIFICVNSWRVSKS